jgi:hypothetical protein
MSHLRWAWIVVLGIAVSGCGLVFDDDNDDPPPPVDPVDPRPPNESSPFTASLCTGAPGGPNCPVNVVPLDEFGVEGTFSFVMQAVGSGVYLSHLELVAGAEGLFVDRLTIRFLLSSGNGAADEHTFDMVVNLRPGESIMLGTAAFAAPLSFERMSLRVAAIGPFRP